MRNNQGALTLLVGAGLLPGCGTTAAARTTTVEPLSTPAFHPVGSQLELGRLRRPARERQRLRPSHRPLPGAEDLLRRGRRKLRGVLGGDRGLDESLAVASA